MLENLEVTLEDRDWPKLKLIVKHGTRVQVTEALYDIAPSKFQGIVNNFLNEALNKQIQRRKTHGS